MSAYDITNGLAAALGVSAEGVGRSFVLKKRVDFANNATLDGDALAADTVKVFTLPPYHIITHAMSKIITAEGATCTAELGLDGDPDGLIDAIDLNAAAGTLVVNASGGALTATEDDIGTVSASARGVNLTLGHDTDTAVVDISIHVINLGAEPDTLI